MKIVTIIKDFIRKAKLEAAKDYKLSPIIPKNASPPAEEKKEFTRKGWIGMDLDGTLARLDPLLGTSTIGAPIPKMVGLVKQLIREGNRVKIFTARASDPEQVVLIHKWLRDNGLPELEVTNRKDFEMIRLYDDRAVQVVTNTGEIIGAP